MGIIREGSSSFFDPPQDSLDPRLWQDERLIPEVRQGMLDFFINAFEHRYSEPLDWTTLWIVGSATSYQYDIDDDVEINVGGRSRVRSG